MCMAWQLVKPETIANCFRKSGVFPQPTEESNVPMEEVEEVEEITGSKTLLLGDTSFMEFVNIDDNVLASYIHIPVPSSVVTEASDEDGSKDEATTVAHLPQSLEVFNALDVLQRSISGNAQLPLAGFTHLNALMHIIIRNNGKTIMKTKQGKIKDYFKWI